MRKLFVLIHRYAGLTMTFFLIIVGVTGSVLAFYHELDWWLNPELLNVPVRDGRTLDPFTLRERAEALESRARIDQVPLARTPGESYEVWLSPKTDPATGKDYELAYSDLYLNPYTGEKIGARTFGEVSLAKENILSFLYRLHYSLALPESTGSLGGYILGITALAWSLDCFVGFYLTLPPRPRTREKATDRHTGESRYPEQNSCAALDPGLRRGDGNVNVQRSFWSRWKPAWLIKRSRLNYDLHRASGLWVWPMLFVLAWSSVAFNLNTEVYQPAMKVVFDMHDPDDLPKLDKPLEAPALGWPRPTPKGNA